MKPSVSFFYRKPRTGFNFSIETVFGNLRKQLSGRIDERIFVSRMLNNGYLSKLVNIIEAAVRQNHGINHITGELHFLNFLMRSDRNVVTIHDCGMVNRKSGLGKYIVQWLYLKVPVKKARYVTTVSIATKNDILKLTGCSADKVIVIPVPISENFIPEPKKFNADQPRILCIGTGYNKNLERVIKAVSAIQCNLSIIGKLSATQSQLLKESDVRYENVYGISDEDMLKEYHKCDILLFASTFEGFGMPIVEANAVGRAVITSNISSMPEVAGEAACLVDPYSIDAIRAGLNRVIQDSEYRETLIRNGFANAKRYSIDIVANQYYEIYKSMSDSRKKIN